MNKIYKAHVRDNDEVQTVKEHSENTASLCREFAAEELKDVMYATGLMHDCGKYQKSFQEKIDGKNIRVEHSGCGAVEVKDYYPDALGWMMAYCIAGHHSGIPDGGYKNDQPDMATLQGRLKRKFEDYSAYENELEMPEIDYITFAKFLMRDCGKNLELFIDKFAFMTRYCFSCLTDADSLDTSLFCEGERAEMLKSDFEKCLQKINDRLSSFKCVTPLQKARALIQAQVFEKCGTDAEIYLMNMPTGSGKTLCGAKFALERAIRTGKKRIIYIIPYNSIIDQTVGVLEDIFGDDAQILRHQSTFSYEDADESEDYKKSLKAATENWGVSSIIVTTMVQFFESIYSNRRGKLRKLHNMADSVLIFDEAHLMPEKYLQPCLRAISYITRYFNSEAVFLTATMPNFRNLVHKYALPDAKIVDLVEDRTHFAEFKKCRYVNLGALSPEGLIEKAADSPSSLIVVNSRRAAREVYKNCRGKRFHLSTYMTALDRKRTIEDIKRALERLDEDYPSGENVPEERRITIVSTSLIEAGVDLDVWTVFRELTGLDSILQAGGRCNREGKRAAAEVYIFEFEDNKRAQDIKVSITNGLFAGYDDVSSPESIEEYYERLFFMREDEIAGQSIGCECANISSIPFQTYAENFEIIESNNVSIVVAQDDVSFELINALKYAKGGVGIGRKLQKYTCSVYKSELETLAKQHAVENYNGIWCLTNLDYYDSEIGLTFEAKDYIL